MVGTGLYCRNLSRLKAGKTIITGPQLIEALKACKLTGATLLIAKLDRLSRNVAFIANLMDSGAEFVACDFPTANRLTIHILAAMAEHEREMISKRTREALQAAKARGVKLGKPENLKADHAAKGRVLGVEARQIQADKQANDLKDIIKQYQANGLGLNAIARELNKAQYKTPRGKSGQWTATAVKNLIQRIERAEI